MIFEDDISMRIDFETIWRTYGLGHLVLSETSNLPIRHDGEVHNGKVRSVYWLNKDDSKRLIKEKDYQVHNDTQLGVMLISDRISAFDCIWQGEYKLGGVPGKGASLNAISKYFFDLFEEKSFSKSHVLDSPHPLVWIVQKAEPIKVEAIARQYITGSMWRAYADGEREFCGIVLPEGLKENQKLGELLITPSTKGVLKGIPGVPEKDDVNVSRQQLLDNYEAFGFKRKFDVEVYSQMLKHGFELISERYKKAGAIFVDTKFEFGYVKDSAGQDKIIFIDEAGTPDSSRMWSEKDYRKGKIVDKSKEGFRQYLLKTLDRDILLNKDRMDERIALSKEFFVPFKEIEKVSGMYKKLAKKVTGKGINDALFPKERIIEKLGEYNLTAL